MWKYIESIHKLVHVENFQKYFKTKVRQFALINSLIISNPLEMKDESIQGKMKYEVNEFNNQFMNDHHQDLD